MAKSKKLATLTLEPRTEVGTTSAHALRAAGKIPGVVYGHGSSTPITIDNKALVELILSGNRSHIVEATIGKQKDSVLLRRIETDPISRKALSVDFQRVGADEAVYATVTVVTTGTPRGVRDQGGVLDLVVHQLEIKGPASNIPDNIVVDVAEMGVHEHLNAGQIALPEGFALVTAADQVVVSVETHRGQAEETGTETAEALPTEAPEGS